MQEKPATAKAGLILAAPFLLLLAAAIISWPWRALNLPGTVGTASPVSVALLVLVLFGGVWAMKLRLPPRLFTWPPAGLGAIIFLTVGFGTQTLEPEASPALVVGYAIVFGFVWIVSVALAKYGVSYAVGFACLFLMAQGMQLQVFEDAAADLPWRSALTAASAIRTAVETGVLVWLAHRLAVRPDTSPGWAAVAMVGLVIAHGPLSAWEQLLGTEVGLTTSRFVGVSLVWLLFSSLLLGVVTVTARLRRGWSQEPEPDQPQDAPQAASAQPSEYDTATRTARRRRRAVLRRRLRR